MQVKMFLTCFLQENYLFNQNNHMYTQDKNYWSIPSLITMTIFFQAPERKETSIQKPASLNMCRRMYADLNHRFSVIPFAAALLTWTYSILSHCMEKVFKIFIRKLKNKNRSKLLLYRVENTQEIWNKVVWIIAGLEQCCTWKKKKKELWC